MTHLVPTIPEHTEHAPTCACATYTPRLSCCAARAVSDAAAAINEQPKLNGSSRAAIAIYVLTGMKKPDELCWFDIADIIAYFAAQGGPI